MTAPTPRHGPHPYPDRAASGQDFPGKDSPGGSGGSGGDSADPQPRRTVSQETRAGVLVALAGTGLGVAMGLLWLWLAPRVPLISDGQAVYLKDSEGEESIAADGWFALLGVAAGALIALGVFWRFRRGGVAVVVGLAVGGLLGSLIAWRLGVSFGPSGDVAARAKEIGAGKVFDAPVQLHAKAALLAWPVAALLAHLGLTTAFGPRDPQVEPGAWGGWGPPHEVQHGDRPRPGGDPWARPRSQQPPRE